MLYRMRQTDGQHYGSGKWIAPDGKTELLASADITMTPQSLHRDRGTQDPDGMAHRHSDDWRSRSNARRSMPRSWMGTSFPYWEGPISFAGSHTGLGYLEMTGY